MFNYFRKTNYPFASVICFLLMLIVLWTSKIVLVNQNDLFILKYIGIGLAILSIYSFYQITKGYFDTNELLSCGIVSVGSFINLIISLYVEINDPQKNYIFILTVCGHFLAITFLAGKKVGIFKEEEEYY